MSRIASKLSDLTTYSRASASYDVDANGNLQTFAPDLPRNGQTLVNYLLNPRALGAVAGTPGVIPTTWVQTNGLPTGLSREVLGSGEEDGIPYLDVRYFGTTTAANASVRLELSGPFSSIPASIGQTWNMSVYVRLLAGTLASISQLYVYEFSAVPGQIGQSAASLTPTSAPLVGQRASVSRVFTQAATVNVAAALYFVWSASGTVVNLTLRVGGPQLERGGVATPLTLPPVGTQAVSYRNSAKVVTNLTTNPLAIGAVAGVVGSGTGVMPYDWVGSGGAGLSCEVMGVVTEIVGGVAIPCLHVRYFGTATGNNFRMSWTPQIALIIGDVYSGSIYLKRVSGTFPGLDLRMVMPDESVNAIGQPDTLTRYSRDGKIVASATGNPQLRFGLAIGTVYEFQMLVGGAQFEKSATTTALVLPPPGTTGVSTAANAFPAPGILLEGAATNLFAYTDSFIAGWQFTAYTLQAPTILGPDKSLSGVKLVVATGSGAGHIRRTMAYTAGTPYCHSCHFKADEVTVGALSIDSAVFANGFGASATYDLVAKTATAVNVSASSVGLTELADGWFRCWMIFTPTISGSVNTRVSVTVVGNDVKGIYVFGAQLEANYYMSSYVSCAASNVTRAADSLKLEGAKFNTIWPEQDLRTNLLRWSNDPSNTSVWSSISGSTAATDGTQAPDGTLAYLVTSINEAGIGQTVVGVIGRTYTVSMFLKAGTATQLRLRDPSTNEISVFFTFATQAMSHTTAPHLLSYSSTPFPNGWHRVQYTFTALTSGMTINPRPSSGNGTYYQSGVQVEETPVAPSPNLVMYPESLDGGGWGKIAISITANVLTPLAPDFTATVDKLEEDATTAGHYVSHGFTSVAGQPYTFSIHVRAAERSAIQMIFGAIGTGNANAIANFDLVGNVVSVVNGATATITALSNGWYRCSLTVASASQTLAISGQIRTMLSYVPATAVDVHAGVVGNGVHLWGGQLVQTPIAPPYVPQSALVSPFIATGTTAISKYVGTAKEGFVIVDVLMPVNSAPTVRQIAQMDDGTDANKLELRPQSNGLNALVVVTLNGVQTVATYISAPAYGTVARWGMRWGGGNVACCVNGSTVQNYSPGILNAFTGLRFGVSLSATGNLNGRISNIHLGASVPSDAKFQAACVLGANVYDALA